ncbi:MAG: type IV pilus assembly protein PilM [Undibacterium sp.]
MFGLKKPTFLGIDFGTSSIKAVELSIEKEQILLENYAEINLAEIEKESAQSLGTYDSRVTNYLRALLKRLEPKTKEAYVAMPAFIGLVALVEFPKMSEKELQDAIQFEAHKYIPSPLEEVALSWEIVGETAAVQSEGTSAEAGKLEVLLVAALNKEVERYESYIHSIEYSMQLLELETFSLVRSVIDGDQGIYLVADIGSRATNLVLVENGLVKISRNLDVGGRDVTRTLTEGLNISPDRAETLKKSDTDYLNTEQTKLIFPALEVIGNEMQRIMAIHQTKHPDRPIDGIILSGGTAGLTGLTTYYSNGLGLPVTIGNPWQRVGYPAELSPAIERMGTSFSVALGLALQGNHLRHLVEALSNIGDEELVGARLGHGAAACAEDA